MKTPRAAWRDLVIGAFSVIDDFVYYGYEDMPLEPVLRHPRRVRLSTGETVAMQYLKYKRIC